MNSDCDAIHDALAKLKLRQSQPMTEMQENRLALLRRFFADYVAAKGGVQDARLTQAFHSVDRAHYCGPGPWWV